MHSVYTEVTKEQNFVEFIGNQAIVGDEIIAKIDYDYSDFICQRWVVFINEIEVYRADTQAKVQGWIMRHYKDGTLPCPLPPVEVVAMPVEEAFYIEEPQTNDAPPEPVTTGNEVQKADYKYRKISSKTKRNLKKRLREKHGSCCFWCDKSLTKENATIEHLIPLFHGGTHRFKIRRCIMAV